MLHSKLRRLGEGDPVFAGRTDVKRDIDIVLMLRHGAHKRADLAQAVITYCGDRQPPLRVAVITPDAEFAPTFSHRVACFALRPSKEAMRDIYERSRLFVLLSDQEGFGLPPLEAMGSGCVPLCRDAGGIRSYMSGELNSMIVPLAAPWQAIADRAEEVLADEDRWHHLSAASARMFREGLAAFERRLSTAGARRFIGS